MELNQLLNDDRAVSPVIGVILMVAITVILAAVIGTFVLGLGDQVSSSPPQASFTFDYQAGTDPGDSPSGNAYCNLVGSDTSNQLEVTHDGGDSITANQLSLGAASGATPWQDCSAVAGTSDVTAGVSAIAEVASDSTVRVTWQSPGGDSTATLGKWTGPGA